MIGDYRKTVDATNIDDLFLTLSDYQIFTPDMATSVGAPRGTLAGGIVLWNLEPGQENDYHMHPSSEHIQFVIEGEVEYSLGDAPPRTLTVGQLVIIPAGLPHGIKNVSDRRASYVAITNPGPYEKVLVERPKR